MAFKEQLEEVEMLAEGSLRLTVEGRAAIQVVLDQRIRMMNLLQEILKEACCLTVTGYNEATGESIFSVMGSQGRHHH